MDAVKVMNLGVRFLLELCMLAAVSYWGFNTHAGWALKILFGIGLPILLAANMDVRDIIKLNYYLVGEIDTARRREIVASKLQGHRPCSTLVFVAGLASPAFRVEIEAWASRTG